MANEYLTVEVKGLDELQERLEALPAKFAKRSLRSALRAGAKVYAAACVAMAPKDTGFLSEHFNYRFKINRDELAGTAYIGPQGKVDYPKFMSGAYKVVRKANGKAMKVGRIAVVTVARFLEFGTSKMAKQPFMTQAGETYREQALNAVVKELKNGLEDI